MWALLGSAACKGQCFYSGSRGQMCILFFFFKDSLANGLTGDTLHSRAALYTALTRLYSASGGLGRLRLQSVQQAHQSQIYHSIFWGALKLPLRSKRRAVFFYRSLILQIKINLPGCVPPSRLYVSSMAPCKFVGQCPWPSCQGTHISPTMRTVMTWAIVD